MEKAAAVQRGLEELLLNNVFEKWKLITARFGGTFSQPELAARASKRRIRSVSDCVFWIFFIHESSRWKEGS